MKKPRSPAACGALPLAIGGWLLPVICLAGSWTNAAGHVIEAEAVAFDGSRVTLKKASGQTMILPLHSLAPNEQKRVKIFFNEEDIPATLRSSFRLAQTQLAHARALRDDGELDAAEFNARKETVVDAFLRECAAQSYPADSEDVQRWLAKIER